ncbi:MAG: hypothetical protein D6812_08620, partial [Deltaproteobacteria bacterium]
MTTISQRPRLLFLTRSLPTPDQGSGTHRYILGVLEAMERIGCRIDLLVIDPYFERGLPWRFVHPDV